ncbi:MAG: Gldg family protein, partial [Planctomycetota bacterium]|nr:Gldg family protein [Planctomycetota bacterium]
MKRLATGLALALGLAAAIGIGRLAGHLPARAVELGATRLIEPDPELVAHLRAAEEPLHVTWFVTDEAEAPASRRGFAGQVTELLGRLRAAAPGKLDFARADPAKDPDLARYAARRGVASFRAEGVRGDQSSSHEVHATLLLERGLARPARLEHLGPEHLPILQALLLERLRESASPTLPRVLVVRPEALAAGPEHPASLDALEGLLAERAEVRTTSDPHWAERAGEQGALWADLTIWVQPTDEATSAGPGVDRYLESGRALVLAAPAAAPVLLAGLGLRLGPSPPADFDADLDGAPDLVTSIAPNQDFRLLEGQPDGSLLFAAPVSLEFDAAALDRRGASGRQLASSAEHEGAPKRGLVALVDPVDPREGRLVVLGDDLPLTDAGLAAPGAAHRPLVALLLDSFTRADRRVLLRAMPDPPERLGELSASARWMTRAWLLLPLPLLLLAIAALRRRRRVAAASQRGAPSSRLPRLLPDPMLALGALVLLAVSYLAADAPWPRADWTAGRLATPTETLAAVAADLADEVPGGEVHAELLFSRSGRLPLGLRDLERRTRALLAACEDAGLELTIERIEPEVADEHTRAVLAARGLGPFHHDLAGARTSAWASITLTAGSREVLLEFAEPREAEELELRLALGLERLRVGRAPRVGLATDLPRLSAAEDYEFQSRGSFAPREGDVFGLARRSLERAGFDVRHVNPRAIDPTAPGTADLDALVWLQPRRELRPMLDVVAGHLAGGGRVLLAAQHFRTQARQYRGADFDQVFWPQPQLIDLDRFLLPELGIALERQLVLDRLTASLPIEARVATGVNDTEFTTRPARQGFLVRVPTQQFESPLLDGVTDLGLADPSRIVLDEQRLAELGLEARPLLRGSSAAWTVAWKGGWLTEAMLSGVPSDEPTDEVQPVPAPAPIFAVDVRGSFPAPVPEWEDYRPTSANTLPSGEPGRLILVG